VAKSIGIGCSIGPRERKCCPTNTQTG